MPRLNEPKSEPTTDTPIQPLDQSPMPESVSTFSWSEDDERRRRNFEQRRLEHMREVWRTRSYR